MKVLIVTATLMEARLLADELIMREEKSAFLKSYDYNGMEVDILVSGIGTTFTTFHLTNTLATENYSLVLNVGIAGSFATDLKIGQVVNVCSEEFADLGIEDTNQFLTLFESGYIPANQFPFENGIIKNNGFDFIAGLPQVRGITSNKSNGRSESINELTKKFNPQVESMEGAAVFYVCRKVGLPFLEIRAISNYIESRDLSKWDIPLALENLKTSVLKVLEELKVR
jgi:futalosine hydrolase